MQDNICGIILKVSYPDTGDTSQIEILGKTMLDWVSLALGGSFCAIDYTGEEGLVAALKPHLTTAQYTVVLYSDTPLITRKTVLDAVYDLGESGENMLAMTRGYVFKTAYLRGTEKIYGGNHRFFDEEDFLTAFSFKQAAMVSEVLKNRIIGYHMSGGVQFDDPGSAFIGCDVIIERNVRIGPNNIITGKTIIKQNARLLWGNTIDSSYIGEGCTLSGSNIAGSYIGANTSVGPYANVRPVCKIGEGCRIGNFVEVKNSVISAGTKIAHLTYVGDADVGESCNIGCGTVFCNYDGRQKHRTKVGRGVFIGSNSNLVAPLEIGDGAFIAAGSTITESVPPNALGIARSRQSVKKDWKRGGG